MLPPAQFIPTVLRCVAALALVLSAAMARAQSFEFVAMGDLPYGDAAKVGAPYRALIEGINRVRPGPAKQGSGPGDRHARGSAGVQNAQG